MLRKIVLSALCGFGLTGLAADKLELRQGDHICIIGNTLADRMQHSGWLETMIYQKFPKENIVVRDLGFSGDELTVRLRSQEFGTPDEWLKHEKADIIFAMFGFNESFKGPAGIEAFKKDLENFIKNTQAQDYSGKGAPRIVLFSPIAQEKHPDPNFPDPTENNQNIKYYVDAMAEVAKAHDIQFVDLYAPSLAAYANEKEALTVDGLHLRDDGYKALAGSMYEGLFHETAPKLDATSGKLRAAINDKNHEWFLRYRTVDGYNVYGGRSYMEYNGDENARETVSVMGTPAFMDFVESIQSEGVQFEYKPMGGGSVRQDSLIVEVDNENPEKNIDELDIALPRLSRRFQREFKNLEGLNPADFGNRRLALKPFTPEETREIVFKTMLDSEIHHTIQLDGSGPADYRSVVGFFARQLLKDLRLVGGYDILYGKVKSFMREHLFSPAPVDLEEGVVLRNLSEPDAGKILYDSFKSAINALTIQQAGQTRIEDRIRLREMRPFRTEYRGYLAARKSIFSKIVGEARSGGFELAFAAFLEAAPDVASFAKNYLAVGFKVDYVKADGDLANYIPDFIVRTKDAMIWIVETKGMQELDLPQKMIRLKQWCADATGAEENGQRYDFVFVDQRSFEQHKPKDFAALAASFREYKG